MQTWADRRRETGSFNLGVRLLFTRGAVTNITFLLYLTGIFSGLFYLILMELIQDIVRRISLPVCKSNVSCLEGLIMTVIWIVLAAVSAAALFLVACNIRLPSLKPLPVHVSLTGVNPRTSQFQFQVLNRKSQAVMVREIGFYLPGKSPCYRRIHADLEGQVRGVSLEPGEVESWTLNCHDLRPSDFQGKGAGYVKMENGKRIVGKVVDLSPYMDVL